MPKKLTAFKTKQLNKYKESIVNNYKTQISNVQNQIHEEQSKTGSLAGFMKGRYEIKLKLHNEAIEKFENMYTEKFATYPKNKGWQPDYSKL